ncbi:MAG: DUF2971 domain-containing protein [Mahellales bacterium]|jgi:hypothetical protein
MDDRASFLYGIDKDFIPSQDLVVVRYMDFPSFMAMLQFKKLHFTRIDKFQDVFEGRLPELFFRGWPQDMKQWHEEIYSTLKKDRLKIFVSCWSALDKESYAMWQIYGRNYGIAIQTTVGKLSRSLNPHGAVIGKVQYIDFNRNTDLGYWCGNQEFITKNFLICKSKAYEYENEVRVLISKDYDDMSLEVDIGIQDIIDKVHVSPFVDKWFARLIRDLLHETYGFENIKVLMSDIEVSDTKE